MKRKFLQALELTVLIVFVLTYPVLAAVNMELILDASSSMEDTIEGKTKMEIAKEVLISFLTELPEDTNVGLRIYGLKGMKPDSSELVLPIEPLNKTALISAILAAQPAGLTPIAYSLEQALKEFQGLEGENVVVLVSDGKETCGGDPIAVAKMLAESGIRVKTYVIGFRIKEKERIQLEQIAQAGKGKYYEAKDATELAQSFKEVKKEVVVEKPIETLPVEIKLKDGSLIIGEMPYEKLPVKTKYGEMDIDMKGIISIVGEEIKLKDGSVVKGKIAKERLNIKPTWHEMLNIGIDYIKSVFFPFFKTTLLPQWKYRRPIKVSGSSSDLTDYQVKITVDTASLISEGKMQSDCGDMRFTDADDTEILPYWIESGCNATSTKIWVKVPNIPSAGTKIYMYYDNSSAISTSNGGNTFEFFDDFNTFDTSKWSGDTSYFSAENGCLKTTANSNRNIYATFSQNDFSLAYDSRGKTLAHNNHYDSFVALGNGGNYKGERTDGYYIWNRYWNRVNISFREHASVVNSTSVTQDTNWHIFSLRRLSGGDWEIFYDGVSKGISSDTSRTSSNYVAIVRNSTVSNEVRWDWVRIRKYASPEPSSAVGSKER